MNKLHTNTVRKWLYKRCQQKAKESYLQTSDYIEYQLELEDLFNKLEDQQNGAISKQKLLELFQRYGISITSKELNSYMRLISSKGPTLSVDQFKRGVENDKAKAYFRRLINKSNERNPDKVYPNEITQVINQMDYWKQRQRLLSRIQDNEIPISQKLEPLERMIKLSSELDVGSREQKFRINRTKSSRTPHLQLNKENYNSISTQASTSHSRYTSRRGKECF